MDFVIYGENDFSAIEVKNACKLNAKDFSGLKAFLADYPEARGVLLYRGDMQYVEGNILVVPAERYLKALVPGAPLPDLAWRRG